MKIILTLLATLLLAGCVATVSPGYPGYYNGGYYGHPYYGHPYYYR